MFATWSEFVGSFVSRTSALARSCFLGRDRWRRRCRFRKHQVDDLRRKLTAAKADQRRDKARIEELLERTNELEAERERPLPCKLPLGEPPQGQPYGEGLIALSVNLAQQIGLRPTERALDVFFRWIGSAAEIPKYQSIRLWMRRIGLEPMNQTQAKNGKTDRGRPR